MFDVFRATASDRLATAIDLSAEFIEEMTMPANTRIDYTGLDHQCRKIVSHFRMNESKKKKQFLIEKLDKLMSLMLDRLI